MAKIIYDNAGNATGYEPGIIYDIGYIEDGKRTPFYVGETSNPEQRLRDHQRAGKNADEYSTLVYQTIHALDQAGIKWSMKELARFGSEGPTDLEDEWVMKHLFDGHQLKNMKKGNARWLEERQAVAGDMRKRGISSYRKYKEVLSAEERQAELDRKHAQWMVEEEERKRKEEEFERLQTVYKQRLREQEETRKRIAAEMAAKQTEFIRQRELENKRQEEARKLAHERWLADAPAREARLRAEAERKLQEEQRRKEEAEELRKFKKMMEEDARDELIERANKNYSDWPELEDRIRHQRSEDVEVKIMIERGYTQNQINSYLAQDHTMHWPPGRVR